MILFIYPFGKRFRQLAPKAHTLAEVIHARHGASSQMIMAVSNIVGSCISLMVNFTAAGALVSVLSPLSFIQGVLIAGLGVLSYTLWSGFRASVMTDFAQLVAMILAAVIIIPLIFFNAGGPDMLQANMWRLSSEQADFFSTTAILEQGAPYFVAVLAYAIGNQTIAQRLFAVREDLIKPTFLTATIGYGAVVIGLDMLGLLALFVGLEPVNGNMNNIIPQMASTYLPPVGIALFFILVVGSLSSTADSDLAALSAIVITDIYAKNLAGGRRSAPHAVVGPRDHDRGHHGRRDLRQPAAGHPGHAGVRRRAVGSHRVSRHRQLLLGPRQQQRLLLVGDLGGGAVYHRALRTGADRRRRGGVL